MTALLDAFVSLIAGILAGTEYGLMVMAASGGTGFATTIIAYAFGLVPSFFNGVIAGLIRARRPHIPAMLIGWVLASFATSAAMVAYNPLNKGIGSKLYAVIFMLIFIFGGMTGTFVGIWIRRKGKVEDNSEKTYEEDQS